MPDLGAPGVKVEEISSGARPVSFSGTAETGVVGLITIPEDFFLGKLRAPGHAVDAWRPLMPLPRPTPTDTVGSWQAALAFLPFTRNPDRKETSSTPSQLFLINGAPRERKDIEQILKTPGVKLYGVKDNARDDKDVVEGARAIRDRLAQPGEYQLELKAGELVAISVREESTTEPAGTDSQGTRLLELVQEALGNDWEMTTGASGDIVEASLRDRGGRRLQVNFRRALLTLRKSEDTGREEWLLAPRADVQQGHELRNQLTIELANQALINGIPFRGDLARMVDDVNVDQKLHLRALQELMLTPARQVTSIDSFEAWQRELGEELFLALLQVMTQLRRRQAETAWKQLREAHQHAWYRWVRELPGMLHLELAIRGFFMNGGQAADIAVALQGDRSAAPDKFQFLRASFDSLGMMAIIAAPGLDKSWQEAILNYAGSNGRADLFAVLETPRYLLTRAEDEGMLGKDRWTKTGTGYEQPVLEVRSTTDEMEMRFRGFSNDELLSSAIARDDRGYGAAYGPWLLVDNPRSIGLHDRYVVCPPSGHVAGMIVATDRNPSGGVHKAPANEPMAGVHALVTTVTDAEQSILNTRSLNILRRRPFAGIRCWGARTTAADPVWRYVNVRRLFLMIERSIRDAIQWAVFRPNNKTTRSELRSSIQVFLNRVYMSGALDGQGQGDSYTVRCDDSNNTDGDIRDGVMVVDIEIRPVYPAEYIRLRFRQAPMRGTILEGV